MKTKLLTAGAAMVFASLLAVGLSAAEESAAMEHSGDAKAETKEKAPMYGARCPSPCGFSVRSHDKQEAIAMLTQHAKTQHQSDLSDQEAEKKVKTYKR